MTYIRSFTKAVLFMMVFAVLLSAGFIPKASAAEVTSAAGLVATTSGSLNVRSADSVGAVVLSKLPSGTHVTLINKTGNWWRVEYAPSSYGYVSADYIKYVNGTYAVQTSTTSGNLNVRGGAGTASPIVGSVPSGRTVLVLSESNGWARILYNGAMTGYVSAQYLKSVMAWPVPASYKINQYFGTHKGIDIGSVVHGVTGDAIIAAQQGKVVYAGWLSGYGYVVYINSVYNGQLIQTRYGHLDSIPLVPVGSIVSIGQKIGNMGNTGTSSGVHLHFEVRMRHSNADCLANVDSTPMNPMDYLS